MTRWKAILLGFGSAAGIVLAGQVLAQATSVSIENFKFAPDTISANAGDAISWTNKDAAPHQIVVSGKDLKTAVMQKGQSAELKIADKGTFDYVCGIHPTMKGKIEVK